MNKHIAKKDIHVYKVAMRVGSDMAIAPFYRKFSYTLGVTYGKLKSLEPVYYPHDECIINEGFHSYRSVERLLKNGKYFKDHPNYRSLAIYKAVIPTGAEYYVNEKGEVVSNQLKIIESLGMLNGGAKGVPSDKGKAIVNGKEKYTRILVNYPQTKDLWASDFIADCP